MTRLERKEAELNKLYEYRKAALEHNNFYWLQKNQEKIEQLEKEVSEAKRYGAMRLSEVIKNYDESVKNNIYKHLLKISLAADFCNECVEQTKSVLKEFGLDDFSLRKDVEELCKISQRIASFVIIPKQNILTDMMTDNSDFIDTCDEAANKHLKEKLKL